MFSQSFRRTLFAFAAVLLIVVQTVPAFATPPASPYAPGETLDPSCAPTDTNCTVNPPVVSSSTLTAGSVLFGNASGSVQQNNANFFWDNTLKFLGIGTSSPATALHIVGDLTVTGINFSNATTSGNLQAGTVSSTGITFTNATGSGNLQIATLIATTLTSSTGITFTNATGSGNLRIGTVSSTGITFTNATGSGNIQIGTLIATTLSSSTGVTFTNATGSGNIQVGTVSSTGITFTNATGSGNFRIGTVSSTGITFTNATGSGSFQIATLIATTLTSSTGITFTNATGSGNIQIGTLLATTLASSTGITFTNATGSGNVQIGTLIATTLTSSTGITFTNATGSGSIQVGTLIATTLTSSTGITFTNATGSGNLQAGTVSSTGITFTNATGSGNFQAATINITGLATLTSSTVLSASPLASASAALLRLGPTTIQGGHASGTFIGLNPSAFNGDFLNFQVNSSTEFKVNSQGRLAIGTSTFYSATTTLIVCALSNCTIPSATTSTNAVAFFASTNGTTTDPSIIARGTITSGQADIGEYVDVVGDAGEYHAGDVLSVATSSSGKFEKSSIPYNVKLAGVVTETAGLIAGGGMDGHGSVVIALAGRVPVKVTGENGPIAIGDYLTSSHETGHAMRATSGGKVIAIALEPFSGSTKDAIGKVLAFVNATWRFGDSAMIQGGTVSGSSLNNSGYDPSMTYSFENLAVKNLTVGSALAPTGFTIFDTATKNPFCIAVENGALKTVPGACSNAVSSSPAAPPPPPPPPDESTPSSSTDSSSVASSSPVSNPQAESSTTTDNATSPPSAVVPDSAPPPDAPPAESPSS